MFLASFRFALVVRAVCECVFVCVGVFVWRVASAHLLVAVIVVTHRGQGFSAASRRDFMAAGVRRQAANSFSLEP